MNARRILVLGGSGFIGTRLAGRLLSSGDHVTIADKVPSAEFPDRWVACDVRDLEALRRVVPRHEIIVNLAAEHRDDVQPRRLYDEVNVEGARLLCRVADEARVQRLVFTSSVAVYGFTSDAMREETPTNPFNDYGRTKLAAESHYQEWGSAAAGRTLVVMRPTVVFGEGNRGNVHNLLRQLASGRFVMIGPGTNQKSMAYVENVAACLQWALSLPPGAHLFNYADKPDYDMNALVAEVRAALHGPFRAPRRLPTGVGLAVGHAIDLVARLSGRRFPISALRVKKFTESTVVDATRVHALGFQPPVALDQGLRRTLAAEFPSASSTGRGT